MIDYHRLWFDVPEGFDLHSVMGFKPKKTDWSWDTQTERLIGNLGSLKLYACEGSLIVQGSLITWVHGHNGTNWDFPSYVKALDKLGNRLGLDPLAAQVTQLEYGPIIDLELPADDYLDRVSQYRRAKRTRIDHQLIMETVFFKNQLRKFLLYDKAREQVATAKKKTAKAKTKAKRLFHKALEEAWKKRNALKVEHRWKKVTRTFGRPIYGWDLIDPAFWLEVDRAFKREFSRISFDTPSGLEANRKDFKSEHQYNLFHRVLAEGGLTGYEKQLQKEVKAGKISRSTKSRRLKAARNTLQRAKEAAKTPDPIDEFQEKVLAYQPEGLDGRVIWPKNTLLGRRGKSTKISNSKPWKTILRPQLGSTKSQAAAMDSDALRSARHFHAIPLSRPP